MKKMMSYVAGLVVIIFALPAPLTTSAAVDPGLDANTNGNKIQCFAGTTDGGANGTCTLTANGAFLNTVDGDSDPNNSYAGVFIQNTNLDGKPIGNINKLAFTYSGSGETGGESPEINIPIDEDGNGDIEAYAIIDTFGCNDGDPNMGTLNAITDPTCMVSYGLTAYRSWGAFVEANSTYRIATNALAFIILDLPGEFTITNIQLGRGPAKPLK
jgi:hypothetical protein